MKEIIEISEIHDNIPTELKCIDSKIYTININEVDFSAVYFLCKENKVIYIGKTYMPLNRFAEHIRAGKIPFDKILFIKVPYIELNEIEHAFIVHYKPTYNGGLINKCSYHKNENHDNIISKYIASIN